MLAACLSHVYGVKKINIFINLLVLCKFGSDERY